MKSVSDWLVRKGLLEVILQCNPAPPCADSGPVDQLRVFYGSVQLSQSHCPGFLTKHFEVVFLDSKFCFWISKMV